MFYDIVHFANKNIVGLFINFIFWVVILWGYISLPLRTLIGVFIRTLLLDCTLKANRS